MESLQLMRKDIANEMTVMEGALATRMRTIVAASGATVHDLPPLDLAGLHVISQVRYDCDCTCTCLTTILHVRVYMGVARVILSNKFTTRGMILTACIVCFL